MEIYNINNIEVLQIEITSLCNARCPGCARNSLTNFSYMENYTWENLIKQENLKYIRRLAFNGNYGDFICHPNSIDFLYKITKKNLEIFIHTNAGIRSAEYWKSLADVLKTFHNHKVVFAIDGTTEEIHSNHRQNTRLSKVLENAKAFISQGGNASWSFVTFKENQHQIIDARNMALEYGFKEFLLVNSYTPILINSKNKELHSLEVGKYIYNLYKHRYFMTPINKIERNFDNSNCPWIKVRRLQIDSDGIVYPCCWSAIYASNVLDIDYTKALSIKNYTLQEIIESNFFQVTITNKLKDQNSYCNTKCAGKSEDFKIHY